MGESHALTFRKAVGDDSQLISDFIWKMAEYEKMADECNASAENMRELIFEKELAEVIFALKDGVEIGFALFYPNFSTFVAKPGIHLEEFFVLEEFRGQGIGKALLHEVARIAHERGCGRLEWWCLDWNTRSRKFYESQGARPQSEWIIYRMDENTLKNF